MKNKNQVEIEEIYRQEIWRYWRFKGEKYWRKESTPYKAIPYVRYLKRVRGTPLTNDKQE